MQNRKPVHKSTGTDFLDMKRLIRTFQTVCALSQTNRRRDALFFSYGYIKRISCCVCCFIPSSCDTLVAQKCARCRPASRYRLLLYTLHNNLTTTFSEQSPQPFFFCVRWMQCAAQLPAASPSRAASARSGRPILSSEARTLSWRLAAAASTDQICSRQCTKGCGSLESTLQWSIPPRCTALSAAERAQLRTF